MPQRTCSPPDLVYTCPKINIQEEIEDACREFGYLLTLSRFFGPRKLGTEDISSDSSSLASTVHEHIHNQYRIDYIV